MGRLATEIATSREGAIAERVGRPRRSCRRSCSGVELGAGCPTQYGFYPGCEVSGEVDLTLSAPVGEPARLVLTERHPKSGFGLSNRAFQRDRSPRRFR